MPTLLVVEGLEFRVYPGDHPPAHVHVWKAGGWSVVKLPTDVEAAAALRSSGMKDPNIARAIRLVEEHAATLWNGWRRYHG